jgi:hypothetical protein
MQVFLDFQASSGNFCKSHSLSIIFGKFHAGRGHFCKSDAGHQLFFCDCRYLESHGNF